MEKTDTIARTIGFIGGGQMAEALSAGLMSRGTTEKSKITVCDPVQDRLNQLKE